MDWSNKKILLFLELLKRERPIWDPTDNNHRSKPKIWAAWKRVSKLLNNTPVPELKAKKRSLMATFRPLLKRKIASIRAGYTGEDVYQPSWFAFDIMESFLGSIYDFDDDSKEKKGQQRISATTSNRIQEDDLAEDEYPIKQEFSEGDKRNRFPEPTEPEKVHVNCFDADFMQSNISESFKTLNRVLDSKKEEDECDLYAKLLAKKLRRYPEDLRLKLMYSIDGLMVENPYPEDGVS